MTEVVVSSNYRPPVSEAVVDVGEESPISRKAEAKKGQGRAYLIPVVFCVIAFGLILAAILGGVDLSILGH